MIGKSLSLQRWAGSPLLLFSGNAKDYWENFLNIVRECSPHDSQSWIPTKVMSQQRSA